MKIQKVSEKEKLTMMIRGKIDGVLITKNNELYLCDLEGAKELIRR